MRWHSPWAGVHIDDDIDSFRVSVDETYIDERKRRPRRGEAGCVEWEAVERIAIRDAWGRDEHMSLLRDGGVLRESEDGRAREEASVT